MWMRSEALVACGLALWAGPSHAGTRVQGEPADEVGVITLERGGFGGRERYRLTLRRDGTATRTSLGATRDGTPDRERTGTVRREDFARLAALLQAEGFFALEDGYRSAVLKDGETVTVTAVRGPVKKQVVNSNRSGPSSLSKIEKAIDDLGNRIAWAAGEEMP